MREKYIKDNLFHKYFAPHFFQNPHSPPDPELSYGQNIAFGNKGKHIF